MQFFFLVRTSIDSSLQSSQTTKFVGILLWFVLKWQELWEPFKPSFWLFFLPGTQVSWLVQQLNMSCNLCHATVFLKQMISIIRMSYSFHILLYYKVASYYIFLPNDACLPFKMPYNPKNANTTNSQCFSIKARGRNDLLGHCIYLVVRSQHGPQGNDALNVSYFLAWWWIRMSQTFRLKNFPKSSDAWNTFYI